MTDEVVGMALRSEGRRSRRILGLIAALVVAGGVLGPSPALSAQGSLIAFVSDRDGVAHIYVIDVGGAGATRVTNTSLPDLDPEWAPDASNIAFARNGGISREDNVGGIHAIKSDGSGATRLTKCPTDESPSWAPVGDNVVFTRQRGKVVYVYKISSNGTSPRILHQSPGAGDDVDWSPGGARIAFIENAGITPQGFGIPHIFTMATDGSNRVQVTEGDSQNVEPAWSPDGSRIAFASDPSGNFDIYLMNSDGSGVTNLTSNPAEDREPTWSPDGTRLAFTSDRDLNDEIYLMNADGTGVTRITTNPASDHSPDWQPFSTDSPEVISADPQPCAAPHERSISLRLSGSLVASGRVTVSQINRTGLSSGCADGPVKVERKSPTGWEVVASSDSGELGRYRAQIPNRDGRYRARAVRFGFYGPNPTDPVREVCLRAVSPIGRHPS